MQSWEDALAVEIARPTAHWQFLRDQITREGNEYEGYKETPLMPNSRMEFQQSSVNE